MKDATPPRFTLGLLCGCIASCAPTTVEDHVKANREAAVAKLFEGKGERAVFAIIKAKLSLSVTELAAPKAPATQPAAPASSPSTKASKDADV